MIYDYDKKDKNFHSYVDLEHDTENKSTLLAKYLDDVTGYEATLSPDAVEKDKFHITVRDENGEAISKHQMSPYWGKSESSIQRALYDAINTALAEHRGNYLYREEHVPNSSMDFGPNMMFGTLKDTRTQMTAQFGTTNMQEDGSVKLVVAVFDEKKNCLHADIINPEEVPEWSDRFIKDELQKALTAQEQLTCGNAYESLMAEEALRYSCIQKFLDNQLDHPVEAISDSLLESWNKLHEKDGKRIAEDLDDASYLLDETVDSFDNATQLGRLGTPFSSEDDYFWLSEDGTLVSGTLDEAFQSILIRDDGEELNRFAQALSWQDYRLRDEMELESAYSLENTIRRDVFDVLSKIKKPKQAEQAAEYLLTHDYRKLRDDVLAGIQMEQPDIHKDPFCQKESPLHKEVKDVLLTTCQKPSALAKALARTPKGQLPVDRLLSASKKAREQCIQQLQEKVSSQAR